MKRSRGLTTVAWIRDRLRTERLPSAVVSSALPRSVLSGRLAGRVARSADGPWSCTSSPSVGKACGPTARVEISIDGCPAAKVRAVVAPLPRGFDLAIGRDVIGRSVKRIQFSPSRLAMFVCRTRPPS